VGKDSTLFLYRENKNRLERKKKDRERDNKRKTMKGMKKNRPSEVKHRVRRGMRERTQTLDYTEKDRLRKKLKPVNVKVKLEGLTW